MGQDPLFFSFFELLSLHTRVQFSFDFGVGRRWFGLFLLVGAGRVGVGWGCAWWW